MFGPYHGVHLEGVRQLVKQPLVQHVQSAMRAYLEEAHDHLAAAVGGLDPVVRSPACLGLVRLLLLGCLKEHERRSVALQAGSAAAVCADPLLLASVHPRRTSWTQRRVPARPGHPFEQHGVAPRLELARRAALSQRASSPLLIARSCLEGQRCHLTPVIGSAAAAHAIPPCC